jgi:uncharacterized protein (DUF305 family)
MASKDRRYSSLRTSAGFAAIGALLALNGATACSTDASDGHANTGGHSGHHSTAGGAGTGGNAGTAGAAPVGDRRNPYTPMSDVEFAAFFADHHHMAIEMADWEAAHGASAEIKAMAASMSKTQTAELKILEDALAALQETVAPQPPDAHIEAEMAEMKKMSGASLDEMFLLDMIPHHAAGLAPAHRAIPHLQRAELVTLAHDIFTAQATEIGMMRKMLNDMGVTKAGEDMAPAAAGRADFGLVGDLRIPLTPDSDLTFIDFFVPHHRAAIEMANEAIARGASADVKAMATMMRDAQTAEVKTMTAARRALTGSAEPDEPAHDQHMMDDMAAMHDMSGAELDQMFLKEMIPHHAAALPTSHRANPHLTRPELKTLAAQMFVAQGEEIGEMSSMLETK